MISTRQLLFFNIHKDEAVKKLHGLSGSQISQAGKERRPVQGVFPASRPMIAGIDEGKMRFLGVNGPKIGKQNVLQPSGWGSRSVDVNSQGHSRSKQGGEPPAVMRRTEARKRFAASETHLVCSQRQR